MKNLVFSENTNGDAKGGKDLWEILHTPKIETFFENLSEGLLDNRMSSIVFHKLASGLYISTLLYLPAQLLFDGQREDDFLSL